MTKQTDDASPAIFTDPYIRGLKPRKTPYKRTEYAPKGQGRLTVRVQPTGAKEFFYRYRKGGVDKTISLGRYDRSGNQGRSLAQLRAAAHDMREIHRDHGDIKAYKSEQEALRLEQKLKRDLEARKGSFGQLLDAYIKSLRSLGKPSAQQADGAFTRYIRAPFPSLIKTKANMIEATDIQLILARMVKSGITRQVNSLRSYLHAAFAFGAKTDNDPRRMAHDDVTFAIKSNPVALIPRIKEFERVGERTLDEGELRLFWKETEALPVVQGAFLRFSLSIGGQRATQLLRPGWDCYDFEENTLLLNDSKGRGDAKEHLVPLTSFALEQLNPVTELNQTNEWPFTSDGTKRMVLETVSVAVRSISEKLEEEHGVPPFRLGDLRRTCETLLAALGISREIRAHILSHGRIGVQGKHYDRYEYLPEKQKALEVWANKLRSILNPTPEKKVIQGRFRKKA